jgi:hypothetical protein
MHIGGRHRDIAQAWCAKQPGVTGNTCDLDPARCAGGILGIKAGIVKPDLDPRAALALEIIGEQHPLMTVIAFKAVVKEQLLAPLGGL